MCDFDSDSHNSYAGASILVPGAEIRGVTTNMYFSVLVSANSRFSIKMTQTDAVTNSITINGSVPSGYRVYCYGR